MEEYDMVVKHRPGMSMKHVDALSRNFVLVIEDGLLQRIRNAQMNDDELHCWYNRRQQPIIYSVTGSFTILLMDTIV